MITSESFDNLGLERTVDRIINRLHDRAGFIGWWDAIDEETQQDIREEIMFILRNQQ